MRLDKFLKVARLIKRRTVANEIASLGRVLINDKPAKPSSEVKEGDILEIKFGQGSSRVRVLKTPLAARKEEAEQLYTILE